MWSPTLSQMSRSMMKQRLDSEPKVKTALEEVRGAALNLLVCREHSVLEMRYKLSRRGYDAAAIQAVLEALIAEDLLNEHRYAELYACGRADKGYGPLRLDRELRERGVPPEIIASVLAGLEEVWMPKLSELQRKRFGNAAPRDSAERVRRIRFLRYRGFTPDQIRDLFQSS
jgi:regulatory protein